MDKEEANSQLEPKKAITFDDLRTETFEGWKIAFISEVWVENRLHSKANLMEQLTVLYIEANKKYDSPDYKLSLSEMGQLFGFTKQRASFLVQRQEKIWKGICPVPPGRKCLITPEQCEALYQWVSNLTKVNRCPTPSELTEFVRDEFKLTCSESWCLNWLKSGNSKLFIVNAKPMEKKRLELTKDDIVSYGEKIKKAIKGVKPGFILNMDESGVDDIKYSDKVVISINNKDTLYEKERPPGHITVLPTICGDGELITPMLIVSRKTMDSDISRYGYPKCNNGYVVSSKKGYITMDLFEDYIETIIIPHIKKKRLGNGNGNSKCIILMDGCSCHSTEKLDALLEENNIQCFFLPAHSSHLTQPLDLLIFATMKKILPRISTTLKVTELSKRILRSIKAIEQAANSLDVQTSFERAGFIMNNDPKVNSATFEVERILKNPRAPDNPKKPQTSVKKTKRVKLLIGAKAAKKKKPTTSKDDAKDKPNK